VSPKSACTSILPSGEKSKPSVRLLLSCFREWSARLYIYRLTVFCPLKFALNAIREASGEVRLSDSHEKPHLRIEASVVSPGL